MKQVTSNRLAKFAIAVALTLGSATALALSAHGGTGGQPFALDCGIDAALIGIEVRSGTLVDAVEAVCIKVDADGRWLDKFKGGRAGGTGGTLTRLVCNDGWAVNGVFGASGNLVDRLGVYCGQLGRKDGLIQVVGGQDKLGPAGGPGGAAFGDVCPSGQAGKGLRGRHGTLIDQIELVCHNPKLPIISNEASIDAPVALAYNAVRREDPAVGFAGSTYLVVWEDYRGGLSSSDLYATRVSASGQVLDPQGILISAASWSQYDPAVTSNGTDFFVVWQDLRNGGIGDIKEDIYGARVTQSGTVSDANGIRISFSAKGRAPDVAWNGTNYMVTWGDGRSDTGNIYGARVTPAGAVLESSGIPVVQATGFQGGPQIACTTGPCLVGWTYRPSASSSRGDVYAARLGGNGAVLDTTPITIVAGSDVSATLADIDHDGSNYTLSWHDSGSGKVRATRVSSSGSIVGTTTDVAAAPANQSAPQPAALTPSGGDSLFVWTRMVGAVGGSGYTAAQPFDLFAARVGTTGAVVDATPIVVSSAANGQVYPAVAYGGGNYLLAWTDGRGIPGPDQPSADSFAARISSSGSLLDASGIDLTPTRNNERNGAAAFDDYSYRLVVWEDDRASAGTDLYAARISSSLVVNGAPFVITNAPWEQEQPAVAFGGNNYLVVWQDRRSGLDRNEIQYDVYGTRVSKTGAVLDGGGFLVSTGGRDARMPAVAYAGGKYFVVWADRRNATHGAGAEEFDIYATQVDAASGEVVQATGIAIAGHAQPEKNPAVTFDGTNFHVVWERGGVVYGRRVGPGGNVLDSQDRAISTGSTAAAPAVAYSSNKVLVVWEDRRAGNLDVRGATLSTSGVVETADFAIAAVAGSDQRQPAVSRDGSRFFVAWTDRRKGNDDIYGTWVDASGMAAAASGFKIANDGSAERACFLTHDRLNRTFVAYQRTQGSSITSDQIGARFVRP